MVGAAPAILLVVVLAARGRGLAVAALGTVAAFVLALAGTTVAGPAAGSAVAVITPGPPAATSSISSAEQTMLNSVTAAGQPADLVGTLDVDPNEIGRARPGQPIISDQRSLLGSSGRVQAWSGGVSQSLQRPLLGFGFGTEDKVFLDRFYVFESTRVENSYIGLWLQVGLVGLAAFLAILAVLGWRIVRGWRALRREPGVAVAAAGIFLAGTVMAIPQSYIYSVGNVATVAFWLGALLLGTAALEGRTR
jgi:hypothetical protein